MFYVYGWQHLLEILSFVCFQLTKNMIRDATSLGPFMEPGRGCGQRNNRYNC
jgi:hypothetical protein